MGLSSFFSVAITTFYDNLPWMSWNLFLALLPLFLAYLLFSNDRKKIVLAGLAVVVTFLPRVSQASTGIMRILTSLSDIHLTALILIIVLALYGCTFTVYSARIRQLIGLLLFYLFLPNAPYVLTDIIHLFEHIRRVDGEFYTTTVVLPMYAVFMFIGLTSYIMSLVEFEKWIISIGYKRYAFTIELITHLLCAIGIYLGRFLRLNSWEVATDPANVIYSTLFETASIGTFKIVLVTFAIISSLYYIGKWLANIIVEHYKVRNGLYSQLLS